MVAINQSKSEVFKGIFVTSLVPLIESTEDCIVQRAPTLSFRTVT